MKIKVLTLVISAVLVLSLTAFAQEQKITISVTVAPYLELLGNPLVLSPSQNNADEFDTGWVYFASANTKWQANLVLYPLQTPSNSQSTSAIPTRYTVSYRTNGTVKTFEYDYASILAGSIGISAQDVPHNGRIEFRITAKAVNGLPANQTIIAPLQPSIAMFVNPL